MRAYLFPVLFLLLLAGILASPYLGVLIWAWVTMMNPHQIAGGWFSTFPLNAAAVGLLMIALFLHQEPILPPSNALMVMIFVLMIWCVITTFAALSPEITTARADLSIKNMIFGIVVASTTRSRVRCQALLWVYLLSYAFFGIKGGGFTIVTGGSGDVVGPPSSSIEDRNCLALVMLTSIPLANYLRMTSANRLVRTGLLAMMPLTAIAVLGTFSRGGLIGLSFLGAYFWWKSPQKLIVAASALVVGLTTCSVLPDRWFDRMSTVEKAGSDESFQGRTDAWRFAFNAASARPTGVGFSGTEDVRVFKRYMPDAAVTVARGRAAHSIYFQVLGDHGFFGLGLYCAILVTAWRTAGRLSRSVGEENRWIAEFGKTVQVMLATYCVAGAALSMAYDASIYCILGALCAVARLASEPGACSQAATHTSAMAARGRPRPSDENSINPAHTPQLRRRQPGEGTGHARKRPPRRGTSLRGHRRGRGVQSAGLSGHPGHHGTFLPWRKRRWGRWQIEKHLVGERRKTDREGGQQHPQQRTPAAAA